TVNVGFATPLLAPAAATRITQESTGTPIQTTRSCRSRPHPLAPTPPTSVRLSEFWPLTSYPPPYVFDDLRRLVPGLKTVSPIRVAEDLPTETPPTRPTHARLACLVPVMPAGNRVYFQTWLHTRSQFRPRIPSTAPSGYP